MPNAYSYIRMSTDLQLRGDSLRRQTELSEKYAIENGLTLIADFKLQDIGVSAFKGDNLSTGALGRFVQAVKTGQIPAGSYLLVESLDRLSRQKINASVALFLDLTQAGINLVTLSDRQLYKAGDTDFTQLIYSIVVMSRAYEESQTKSMRVGSAWSQKRANAATKKLTRICPAWLALANDRKSFEVVVGRDEIVQRMFRESSQGIGTYSITRRLNAESIPTFGTQTAWNQSYVTKILQNRAVLGEYQPHRFVGGKRVPDGEPILDYFPRVIEENLFLSVQAGRTVRATKGSGRKGITFSNLFTHVAVCDYCGSPMRYINKGKGPKGGTYLKCLNAINGQGCIPISWRYSDFETSFLFFTKEIDLASILEQASIFDKGREIDEEVSAIGEKLSREETKRANIFELLGVNETSVAVISQKLDECTAEITNLVQRREELILQKTTLTKTISADDLKQQIDDFQAPSLLNFERRALLANRISSMVRSLRLSVVGKAPFLQKTKDFLAKQELDAEEFGKILDNIIEATKSRMTRTFQVTLVDGSLRHIVLDGADPTKVKIEYDGKTYKRDGQIMYEYEN